MGGGSGGRIAIYSSSYSFAGITSAYGGTGPSTDANGAAGTIYLETGSISVYKTLIVNNNRVITNIAQRTSLSDTSPSNTGVTYFFDELVLLGNAQFSLKVANSDNAFRTNLTFGTLSGDASGVLQIVANTLVSVLNANFTGSISTYTSADPMSVAYQNLQYSSVHSVRSSLYLNTSSILVYSRGRLLVPSTVVIGGSSYLNCQGDLFGLNSITISENGHFLVYDTCRSSNSPPTTFTMFPTNNTFQLSDIYMVGSSSLSLVHSKNPQTSMLLSVLTSVTMLEYATVLCTGLVQLSTPIFNMSSSAASMSGNSGGFTPAMINTFCPQPGGQTGFVSNLTCLSWLKSGFFF
jgi:hypothetical protein